MRTPFRPRSIFIGALLFVLIVVLVVELLLLFAKPPDWVMPDYNNLLRWGRAAREGNFYFLYPAPVLLWVAVPLSILPTWFAFVWLAGPFAVLLYMFRKNAFIVWLFFPVLLQAALGELDGRFLLPLYWIFADTPVLSAVSCALLTLKPQLGFLLVPFTLFQWLANKNWKSLLQFGAAFAFLYAPTFIIDPTWPLKMITEMQSRAGEFLLPTRGVSFWWWPRDTIWAIAAQVLAIAVVAVLFLRLMRQERYHKQAVYLLGLLIMPVLYAVSYITIAATLRNSRRELVAITLASWIAYIIDQVVGGWGGAYALIPIVALACIAQVEPCREGWLHYRFSFNKGWFKSIRPE